MKINKHLIFVFAFIIIGLSQNILAQETLKFSDFDSDYKLGLELFDKEKYGAAQEHFQKVIDKEKQLDNEFRANAEYYRAICAIELYNEDAEYLISGFISRHPESSKVNAAYFNMGKFQYRQKEYANAVKWFEFVNKDKLNEEDLAEYYFKSAYSYFMLGDNEKATSVFYEIINVDTKYTGPALYYYSHITYNDKNYETALQGFLRLSKDETFAPIVPYYISQIYYLQERYEKVVEYAPPILKLANAKRTPEIAKLIGDSYYKNEMYEDAVNYLKIYSEKANNISRKDYYMYAYAYYKNNKYDSAATFFEKVVGKDDLLTQNAYFHLADSYIESNKKNKARLAFEFASKLDFDPEIKEEALFNYAVITYEMFHSPFNEAISAFHEFIKSYPQSDRLDDAYNFLVMAYMYTSNYKEALTSLDKIKSKDPAIKEAYQKVAYYRGLELYNNLHYADAVIIFQKSLKYSIYNKGIAARSYYWLAEANYQLEKFNEAKKQYNKFILCPGAFQADEFNIAHYNLAYSYFKLKDYSNAILWFRKFLNFENNNKTERVADANNRIADCYFIRRSYWLAIDYYDKAIELNLLDKDYALFQRGFALGLVKRPNKKIPTLKRLIAEHPESAYIDDALFELGKTYTNIQDNENAILKYEAIVNDYPTSSYMKRSLVQLGLINYNKDNNEVAMKYYKRVVAEYPNTSEAKNALTGIKNIYIDINDVDSYFTYVNGLGDFADISMSEKDSLTYISAENIYMKGDCANSIRAFEKYLQKFSNGNYALNTHFYKADCQYRNGDRKKALESFNYIIAKPKNTFTEQALLNAAKINYNFKYYSKAIDNYKELEKIAEVNKNLISARIGLLRANYILKDYNETIISANKLLHTEKIPEGIIREARYKKGMSLYNNKDFELAMDAFRLISEDVNSSEGAEAKYRICDIYYFDKQYDIAEHEIFDFIEQKTSQEYWLAKAYILLSDVYLQKDDSFQAKHTLKSIIDNYNSEKEDRILILAKEKYNNIIETEKYNVKNEEDKELKIEFKENKSNNYDELFKENKK
ncbi:MAG: tetratricopeptide repeat protein [Bacteroidales bacterium]|jgi:TolA-binding protein|nr:tetratricopeptide repeat protein [Bacteroidales bacterium]